MKYCIKCGSHLEEHSLFCVSCGTPVEDDGIFYEEEFYLPPKALRIHKIQKRLLVKIKSIILKW